MSGTGKELLARPEVRAAYLEGRPLNTCRFSSRTTVPIFVIMTVIIGGGPFMAGRGLASSGGPLDGACLDTLPLAFGAACSSTSRCSGEATCRCIISSSSASLVLLVLCVSRISQDAGMKDGESVPLAYESAGPLKSGARPRRVEVGRATWFTPSKICVSG